MTNTDSNNSLQNDKKTDRLGGLGCITSIIGWLILSGILVVLGLENYVGAIFLALPVLIILWVPSEKFSEKSRLHGLLWGMAPLYIAILFLIISLGFIDFDYREVTTVPDDVPLPAGAPREAFTRPILKDGQGPSSEEYALLIPNDGKVSLYIYFPYFDSLNGYYAYSSKVILSGALDETLKGIPPRKIQDWGSSITTGPGLSSVTPHYKIEIDNLDNKQYQNLKVTAEIYLVYPIPSGGGEFTEEHVSNKQVIDFILISEEDVALRNSLIEEANKASKSSTILDFETFKSKGVRYSMFKILLWLFTVMLGFAFYVFFRK